MSVCESGKVTIYTPFRSELFKPPIWSTQQREFRWVEGKMAIRIQHRYKIGTWCRRPNKSSWMCVLEPPLLLLEQPNFLTLEIFKIISWPTKSPRRSKLCCYLRQVYFDFPWRCCWWPDVDSHSTQLSTNKWANKALGFSEMNVYKISQRNEYQDSEWNKAAQRNRKNVRPAQKVVR